MNSPLSSYLKANGGMERKVIIRVLPRTIEHEGPFGFSSQELEFDRLIVWADDGLKDAFKDVPGIMLVSQDKDAKVRYIISVDPRYNLQWVMAEIEAAAQLHESKPDPAPIPDDMYSPAWIPNFTVDNGQNS